MTVFFVEHDADDAPILEAFCQNDHTYETVDSQGYTQWHNGPCTCELYPVGISVQVNRPVTDDTDLDDLPF